MLHPEALAQTLPILAKGMAGIFLVIGGNGNSEQNDSQIMLLLPAKKQVDLRPSGKQRFPLPFGRAFFGGYVRRMLSRRIRI